MLSEMQSIPDHIYLNIIWHLKYLCIYISLPDTAASLNDALPYFILIYDDCIYYTLEVILSYNILYFISSVSYI